jgi:TRAP-type C4-dicarboxylate transport system permease small subunit
LDSEIKGHGSVAVAIVSLSRIMNIVAMATLVLMMLLTVADVLMRSIFKLPILDSPQLTQYLMVCVVYFGLAYCAAKGRHVKVDLIVSHLSTRVQAILDSITYLLGLGICIIMTWRTLLETFVAYRYNAATTVLEVPAYPFHVILTFGVAILCLVMLIQLIQHMHKAVKG